MYGNGRDCEAGDRPCSQHVLRSGCARHTACSSESGVVTRSKGPGRGASAFFIEGSDPKEDSWTDPVRVGQAARATSSADRALTVRPVTARRRRAARSIRRRTV